jgi:hypothetical protein
MYRGLARRRFEPSIAVALSEGERTAVQQAAGQPSGPPVYFDPMLYPPPGSKRIDGTDQVNVAGAGVAAQLPGCTIQLDKGQIGVIDQIELFVDNPALITRAVWQIRVNGNPVPGFSALTMLFRAAASLARDFTAQRIQLPAGAKVEVFVTNVDGAARVFGAQLVGWQYRGV